MNSRRLVLVGVALVAIVAIAGVAMNAMKGPPAHRFVTQAVVLGDIEKAVLASGALLPSEVVSVGAQTSGQIMSMKVKLGQQVEPGQLMAEIDPTILKNQVRQAETQLGQAKAQLGQMTAQFALQEGNMKREQTLMDRGVGAQAKLDSAIAAFKGAAGTVTQIENNVRNQELNVELAKTNLEKANIRAPISGVVAEIVAHEGQTVSTNQQVPTIVKLAKMETMTVRAQVSEADIIKVHPGQKVYFTILGDPGRQYHATLRTRELTPAGGVLDPTGGGVQKGAVYYNALFEVPNKNGDLLPAMTAEVHVVLAEAKQVPTVPVTALGDVGPDGLYTVRVMKADGVVEARKVAIGLANAINAEVKTGLKVGEQVVVGEADAKAPAAAAGGSGGKPLFPGLAAPQS